MKGLPRQYIVCKIDCLGLSGAYGKSAAHLALIRDASFFNIVLLYIASDGAKR